MIEDREMHLEQIEQLTKDEYAFFVDERNNRSLTAGPKDLELIQHDLRVLLQDRTIPDLLRDYLALFDCQNSDGAWSPFSADNESTVWVSAFCGLMLIRGHRLRSHAGIAKS